MLSACVEHFVDGGQSSTTPGWNAPVTWPTYCVAEFCLVFVSVQSMKDAHVLPRLCRYGIAGPNATPPTLFQVRFSNENTTTDR